MGTSGRFAMASSDVRSSEAGTDDPRPPAHPGTGQQEQSKLDGLGAGCQCCPVPLEECSLPSDGRTILAALKSSIDSSDLQTNELGNRCAKWSAYMEKKREKRTCAWAQA